jgi:DNA polymerase III epsilon subunit-like protein
MKLNQNILNPKYIIYDFETDTHTDIHKPNHVEVDVLEIDENQTHDYQDCLLENFGIKGYGCENKFCDWLFSQQNAGSTVIAHNGAGYDNKFILQYCLFKGLTPSSFIRQGSRITYMRFEKFNIRFIDSYHFSYNH